MQQARRLFSIQGRTTRLYFWIHQIGFILMCIPVFFITNPIAEVLYLIVLFVAILAAITNSITRFHDKGKSGWWILMGFIPIFGTLYLLVSLGFLSGEKQSNAYGEVVILSKKAIFIMYAILCIEIIGLVSAVSFINISKESNKAVIETIAPKDMTTRYEEIQIGSLEPGNVYPVLLSEKWKGVSSSLAMAKLNQSFKQNALENSCIYHYRSKEDLISAITVFATSKENTDTDLMKRIQDAKLFSKSFEEVQNFYATEFKPSSTSTYAISFNGSGIVSGIFSASSDCALGKLREDHVVYPFTVDTVTGKYIHLQDIVQIDIPLYDLLHQKIETALKNLPSDSTKAPCYQTIGYDYTSANAEYLATENILLGTSTFSLYPSYSQAVIYCEGTHIDVSYDEIKDMQQPYSVIERIQGR